jgi:hypothetical protein
MEQLLDVITVSTRDDYTLELVFENGARRIFDMKPFFEKKPLPSSATLHSFSRPLLNTALSFGQVILILHRRHFGTGLCLPEPGRPESFLNPFRPSVKKRSEDYPTIRIRKSQNENSF